MPTAKKPLPSKAAMDAGLQFAVDTLKRMPQSTPEELEAHLNGVLIIFWGALWGTQGTEHARGFIEAQLRGMKDEQRVDVFTPPRNH